MRKREAAKRGRMAEEVEVVLGLRLIRAASWLRDGIRVAEEEWSAGLGASGAVVVIVGRRWVEEDSTVVGGEMMNGVDEVDGLLKR